MEGLTKIFSKFDNTANGHNKGGMHIHCSYNKLNNKKVLKLINFIYSRENENFICQIAQRRSNSYFNFDLNSVCSSTDLINLSLKKDFKIKNNNRYGALNFTNDTIEFRIFNSNLRKERILKNLNFVESILSFIASKYYSNSYIDFEKYIMKNKKHKYLKDFVKYLNEQ